jgi:16S rRNA (cytosine967-C5)-methyltransferase
LKQLKDIIAIQRAIMINSASYLKPNGKLLYSTCTLNIEENEKNVDWFLESFPEFNIEPIYFGKAENIIYNDNGSVTILPNENMDGFFIAKFKKA